MEKGGMLYSVRVVACIAAFSFATSGCRPTSTEKKGELLDSGSSSTTTVNSFVLHSQLIDLPLPLGFGPHPQGDKEGDLGAVDGRYELIINAQKMDLAKAKAAGSSFDDVMQRLAEMRREAVAEYAADLDHVEPAQAQMLGSISTIAFRARLSRPPFAGVTSLSILAGLPGARPDSTTRFVLTFSFYDYQGGSPDALAAHAKELLAPLTIHLPQ